MLRNALPLEPRYDTSVTPFLHVSEERRRGILQSVVARILHKKNQSGFEQTGVVVVPSIAPIIEPPPYSEGLVVGRSPNLSNSGGQAGSTRDNTYKSVETR